MAKATVKLFRTPSAAEKAVGELKSRGYKAKEIGILLRNKEEVKRFGAKGEEMATANVSLPEVGPTIALGYIAQAIKKKAGAEPKATQGEETVSVLAEMLGIPGEVFGYYQTGLSLGGVAVCVCADEARLSEARQVLRTTEESSPAEAVGERRSPGFEVAERMTETDPLDAKMTGDFRRY